MGEPLPLGTQTRWGRIGMVGLTGGERYYWMIDRHGTVAMMPAHTVEALAATQPQKEASEP